MAKLIAETPKVNDWVIQLPHVNVALNSLPASPLVLGFVLIKQRKEKAHRNVMLGCVCS